MIKLLVVLVDLSCMAIGAWIIGFAAHSYGIGLGVFLIAFALYHLPEGAHHERR